MFDRQFQQVLGRAQKACERLYQQLVIESKALDLQYAKCTEHLKFAEKDRLNFAPIQEGAEWGRSADLVWESAWFSLKADLGAELDAWRAKGTELGAEIALQLNFNGEGLVFSKEGEPLQGISEGSVLRGGFQRSLVPRAEKLLEGGKLELWLEAAANTLFGLEREDDPRQGMPRYYGEHIGRVNCARIILFDRALWQFLLDVQTASQIAKKLLGSGTGQSSAVAPRARRLIYALDQSLSRHAYQRGNLASAHKILRDALRQGNAPSEPKTIAVGHAHIDTAWLWPLKESVRKCARTFANQLKLMEHYPGYIFGASQAQHYQFVKEHYPGLYRQIQQRVKDGRWEVQGGMWVEADANIPSGESLVRQIIHGKNFFRDEFGVDVENLWLPDVFGYSANLPQLLQRAGIKYFLTQKLSWSQYNDFPHHTFLWQGIDGSEVLTHFPPEATYNSVLSANGLRAAQNQFKEGHFLDEFMTLFGIGDGGGGPDEEQLERGLSFGADGGAGAEGCPQLQFGRADQFFQRLEARRGELASWSGELYLELHRGTLTTHAKVKAGNRRLEQQLRVVEYLYSLDSRLAYPTAELEQTWKMLLLHQFHDIIPGSSIHEVYHGSEGTHQKHAAGLALCERLIEAWRHAQKQDAAALSLVNPYSLPVQALVPLPEGWRGARVAEGQADVAILGAEAGLALLRLEAQAIAVLHNGAEQRADSALQGKDLSLENDLVRYTFNEKGQLTAAFDKREQREILASDGLGNRFSLYQDWPRDWDAWDIDLNYEAERLEEIHACEASCGGGSSLQQSLQFRYKIGERSSMSQRVSLEAHSKRLDFFQQVDWREKHRMLRVSFEPELRSKKASYDIHYGYLERPTHRNTSWDMAQFEVLGQRYADLSDHDYGVSLLNDSKYGHKILGNWMDLNLLRSPTLPDPDADQSRSADQSRGDGTHEFRYAFLPHSGTLQEAMPTIQAEAALFNAGVLAFAGQSLELVPPIKITGENVTLEVVKQAEKSADIIVRLVERAGKHSRVRLHLAPHLQNSPLQECDLMEWHELGEPLENGTELLFSPFALRSFRIRR